VKVEDIQIRERRQIGTVDVFVDGMALSPDEKNSLAWRDGFRGRGIDGAFGEMVEYWLELHPAPGLLDFEGDLIHWKYAR